MSEVPPAETSSVTEPSPLIPWGWLRAVVYLVIYLIYTLVMSLVAYVSFGIESADDMVARLTDPPMILFGAIQIGVLLGITALLRKLIDRRSFVSLGFSLRAPFLRDLLVGLAWGILMVSVVFLILYAVGAISVVSVQFPATRLLIMIPVLLFAAAQEEIVLRGYLLNNLMKSCNRYLALVLTSLLFSLLHILNPNLSAAGLINILLAGLLLGIYYVHRENLWFPIGLHLSWNLFQGGFYGSPVSGLSTASVMTLEFDPAFDSLTGGSFGFEAGWLTAAVLIATTVILHMIYRPKGPEPPAIPQNSNH